MADMDIAVGIGRPVMQDEFRPAGRRLAQQPVEIHLRPAGQDLGLFLRQTGAHRKIRLRQIKRLRIVRGLLVRPAIGGLPGRMFIHFVQA